MTKEYISKTLFDTLKDKSSLSSIVENQRAIHLVLIGKEKYVICGFASSGAIGYIYHNGYAAIDLRGYKGHKKPLYYSEHFSEVDRGNRERSYDGMKLKYKNGEIVLVGPQKHFYPLAEEKQLELF